LLFNINVETKLTFGFLLILNARGQGRCIIKKIYKNKTRFYEIQINECTPHDKGVSIEGGVDHLCLSQTDKDSKSYVPFKTLVEQADNCDDWWVMMEISVWLKDKWDEWDRQYLGCFYIDKRFKQEKLIDINYDNEYIGNVPKYVEKQLQNWMSV
jgi:hypothetical protein